VVNLTIGLWIVPTLLSLASIWWCQSQNYSGDYNFTALFTVPVSALAICFVWMVYFGLEVVFGA
jgi:hypothetical protein